MHTLDYCRQKLAQSGSSFLTSFRFLSPAKRDALTVLYAFCRELDDVADGISDPNVAQATLAWWRKDLGKAFSNEMPEHPVNQALQRIARDYDLPENEFSAMVDGMQMDLNQMRYSDFAQLQQYCYCVAGVVGRLLARILGFSDAQTLQYAEKMGLALQLTNIIRDVGEDARMGRIYLPVNELQEFNVPASHLMHGKTSPEFDKLMAFQIERAEQTYRQARALLPRADEKNQKAGLMMAAVYFALLQEIKHDGAANVLRYKIAIPKPRQTRIALKTWLLGFKP